MNWRNLMLVAAAIAVSFVLAFVCESLALRRYLVPTPGLMLWALLPPTEGFDFSFIVVSLLIDAVCWLAILMGAYALIRRFRRSSG